MQNKRLMKLARRLKSEPSSRGATVEQGAPSGLIESASADAGFVFAPAPAIMAFRMNFPRFKLCSVHEAAPGTALLRLAGGSPDAASSGRTAGFSIQVPDDFERAVSGSRLVLRVVARAEPGGGSARFAVAYSTNEVGNSGWHWFDAGPEWSIHEVSYDVPAMVNGNGDFVGLLPGPPGTPAIDVLLIAGLIQQAPPSEQPGSEPGEHC